MDIRRDLSLKSICTMPFEIQSFPGLLLTWAASMLYWTHRNWYFTGRCLISEFSEKLGNGRGIAVDLTGDLPTLWLPPSLMLIAFVPLCRHEVR